MPRSRDYCDAVDLDRKFWFVEAGGERALGRAGSSFLDVADAVLRSKAVSFSYVHFDGRSERTTAKPLTIALHQRQFYVICDIGKKLHPFRFGRMTNVSIGAAFKYPTDGEYDPAVVFRDAFGIFIANELPIETVKLRLSADWQHYAVTHRWHETQRETVNDDGTVDLTLKAPICLELKRWILWFGADARVVAPASLREWVEAQFRAALVGYGAKPGLASVREAQSPKTRRKRAG